MKITQLMLAKGFGGAERYFVDLSFALAAAGHDVQVICHKKFKQLSMLKSNPSLRVVEISPAGWWDIFAQRKILNALSEHRPAVVQAHLARGAHLAGKACKKLGIPLAVKTHNYVDLKYYKNVDCFITTTKDQQNYLLKQGINKKKIIVIPNFSSMKPVGKITTSTEDQCVNIVSYGRLVKKKGFHILLDAINQLHASVNSVKLQIGGDGPEYKSLLHQTEKLGLDKQVNFCGWIDDVRSFVKGADIFVLPSLDEPFGIAILEMMALGLPIIATRTQGPLEILDEKIAWLVAPGDVDALARALNEAIKNQKIRAHKAELALGLFMEKYAESVVVPQLIALYERLAMDKSNHSS